MTKHVVAHLALREWIDVANATQTGLAERLGVTRAAVSKWCSGSMAPSKSRAKALEKLTGGAVLASLWPRRQITPPATRGALVLRRAVQRRKLSIMQAAQLTGIPVRALHRWVIGENAPRRGNIQTLNNALGLNLRVKDFEVSA